MMGAQPGPIRYLLLRGHKHMRFVPPLAMDILARALCRSPLRQVSGRGLWVTEITMHPRIVRKKPGRRHDTGRYAAQAVVLALVPTAVRYHTGEACPPWHSRPRVLFSHPSQARRLGPTRHFPCIRWTGAAQRLLGLPVRLHRLLPPLPFWYLYPSRKARTQPKRLENGPALPLRPRMLQRKSPRRAGNGPDQ